MKIRSIFLLSLIWLSCTSTPGQASTPVWDVGEAYWLWNKQSGLCQQAPDTLTFQKCEVIAENYHQAFMVTARNSMIIERERLARQMDRRIQPLIISTYATEFYFPNLPPRLLAYLQEHHPGDFY